MDVHESNSRWSFLCFEKLDDELYLSREYRGAYPFAVQEQEQGDPLTPVTHLPPTVHKQVY